MTRRVDTPQAGTRADVEVAVLDRAGTVVSVNEAWERFARDNGGDPSRTGVGVSFLRVCDVAGSDPVAVLAASAVRSALAGRLPAPLSMVIPCHGPHDRRWFDMLVTPRLDEERRPAGATLELAQRGAPDEGAEDARPDPGADPDDDVVRREHLRIAGELHAGVVHGLFALAMDAHALASQADDALVRRRLMQVVEGIDDAIVALRRTVFDLAPAAPPRLGLRERLSQVLDRAAEADLETTLAVQGGIDLGLTDRDVVDVVAVVRGCVTHAVRSAAGTVAVRVGTVRGEIEVEVTHDGTDEVTGPGLGPLLAERWDDHWRGEATTSGPGRGSRWTVRLDARGR